VIAEPRGHRAEIHVCDARVNQPWCVDLEHAAQIKEIAYRRE
jgi:hypothetical protein